MVDVLVEQYANDCFDLELATELIFEICHTALLTAHCLLREIFSSNLKHVLSFLLHSLGF